MIVILGESGAGKTTLKDEIIKNSSFKDIISTTSRPIRSNENGDEYHFLSIKQFEKLLYEDKFVEHAVYNNWHYGLQIDDIKKDGVVILTPHGLRQMKAYLKRNNLENEIPIFSIYLKVDRRSRLIKLIETRDDIEECYRRNLSDIGMFDGLEDEVSMVLFNDRYQHSPEMLATYILRNYSPLWIEQPE